MDLKRKATKGLAWNFAGLVSSQGVGFVISIFLARLLSPAEFGIVGMAMVFIYIIQVFGDFGFASALIQSKENTSETYSSIFFINVLAGILLFGLFQIIAPFIGNFYRNPEVTSLIRWLSLNFILNSFNIVQHTILRRNIDFKTITIRDLSSQMIGGVVGVIMAFKGFGVYSLVAQNLLSAFVDTIFLWKITEWYPKLEFSLKEVKRLTGFSAYMFFEQITSRIFARLDVIFIAKVFNAATLGFYTRSQSLNNLVTQYSSSSLSNVFFPVLSTIQDDEKAYQRVYYKLISMVCFLSFLLTGILFIWGKIIIISLFGAKWLPSVPIFQILVLSAFALPISSIMVVALLGKGKSKENFYFGLFRKSLRILPLLAGFYYGIIYLTWGIVLVSYIITIINIILLKRYLRFSIWKQVRKMFEGIFALLLVIFIYARFELFGNDILNALIFSLLFVLVFLSWNYLIKAEGFFYALDFLKGKTSSFFKKYTEKYS